MPDPRPYEIRLIINRQGDAYTAHWVESGGQESVAFSLVPPLTAAAAIPVLRLFPSLVFSLRVALSVREDLPSASRIS